jgi:hypothetical protein
MELKYKFNSYFVFQRFIVCIKGDENRSKHQTLHIQARDTVLTCLIISNMEWKMVVPCLALSSLMNAMLSMRSPT